MYVIGADLIKTHIAGFEWVSGQGGHQPSDGKIGQFLFGARRLSELRSLDIADVNHTPVTVRRHGPRRRVAPGLIAVDHLRERVTEALQPLARHASSEFVRQRKFELHLARQEIGRASCRERVANSWVSGAMYREAA